MTKTTKKTAKNEFENETKMAQAILAIVKKEMGLDTLETRNSDSLDFHEFCVATIKDAMIAAYKAGAESRNEEIKMIVRFKTSK
jgi:hypothetical protein